MVLHDTVWYCMVLHGTVWDCMVLDGTVWDSCIAWYCVVIHGWVSQYGSVLFVLNNKGQVVAWQLSRQYFEITCTAASDIP